MKKVYLKANVLILVSVLWLLPLPVRGEDKIGLSKGQVVYVPAYSHIYSGDQEKPFLLTVTLSIRNIDPKYQIELITINYYQTQGTLLKRQLEQPVILKPLESIRYIIPQRDKSGGSGANFIVEWKSEKYVNPPIAESIMIGTQSGQGISFSSRGRVILSPKE